MTFRSISRMIAAAVALWSLGGCGSDAALPVVMNRPTATATPSPTAIADELSPADDNGAAGRNPFNNPSHVAPKDACSDVLHASVQSLVLRVLPRGPLQADASPAFTSGVCVYLPPGYTDSGLRYPVLYLLHGGGGDAADWVTFGGIRTMMDDAIAADPTHAAIVVMPDGTDAQWYDSFDGKIKNEQYVRDYLIPYMDRHFRTIAGRNGRAIDGLSNGGYGSVLLSAKAPDQFVAIGAMSSNLAGLSFTGIGSAGKAPAYYHGNLPVDLASNLDQIDLTMDIGTLCITDQQRDNCLAWQFEQLFVPANRAFHDRLLELRPNAGRDDSFEYRETEGGHSWNWWPLWLRERHLPYLWMRLANPRSVRTPPDLETPPARFRYRSVAPSFAVWGYEVDVVRAVREFLELRDVTTSTIEIQGAGNVTVHSASVYVATRRYVVSGAGGADQHVTADVSGRIAFAVDLGASHTFEQYTKQATDLESAGGYWMVRDVVITAE